MEHLGNMDVYVALEDKKVSTNFMMEKEEYLDFMEEHMDILTARLNKRGYDCSVKATLRDQEEEEQPVIKKIEGSDSGNILLSTQAFDMRA
jgi:flagellar hook-length control protein FliK